MTKSPHNNRESWGGWISNKVATAEAALSTAFVEQTPTRSRSFQNLRAVAKASRLATLRQQSTHEDEVIPPLTRRASAIDVTLSSAWSAVRSAAVAAMATFDQPDQPDQPAQPPASALSVSTDTIDTIATHPLTVPQKAHFHAHTEMSDVTISASCSSADFSEHNQISPTSDTSLDNPRSPADEDVRISATSCNHQHPESDGEHDHESDRDDERSCGYEISEEQLRQLVDDFKTMFEQNGGAECVARVKQIGDTSLETMREPETLNEAVEKELNEAKSKLDDTLQRLECAARSKVSKYSDRCDAAVAAQGLIEETKENTGCGNGTKRNATLLQDCTRLVAVFASKICGWVLDGVESDKGERTWNERVDSITRASARGIRELRIIAMRFVEGIKGERKDAVDKDEARGVKARILKVADAGVEEVVKCVALGVAALQVEMCERAYELCG